MSPRNRKSPRTFLKLYQNKKIQYKYSIMYNKRRNEILSFILKITKLHNLNALFVWHVNHSLNKSLLIKRAAARKWTEGVRADMHAFCSWIEFSFSTFPESEFCVFHLFSRDSYEKSQDLNNK